MSSAIQSNLDNCSNVKNIIFIYLFTLILFLFNLPVRAAVDLELTEGVRSTIPIAVIPFEGQDNFVDSNNIAQIINHDLQYSGRFRLLEKEKINDFPTHPEQLNFKLWQGKGIDNLVIGTVKPIEGGRYQVSFQLFDVYGGKSTPSQSELQNALLLNKQFIVTQRGMRRLAHHLSDLIYEKLTGDRGVFSTHIAYIDAHKEQGVLHYSLMAADADGYQPQALLTSTQPLMSPAWSPDGRKIAYVSFEKGQAGVYVQELSTGNRKAVTEFQGINGAPAWSPDGTKLAVVLTKSGFPKIHVLNLITNELTQATTGTSLDTEPNFSPDGKSLIFTSSRSGGPQIYRVNLANGQIQRLTFEGGYNASGCFTPDGKNIVMLHQENGLYNVAIQNLATGKMDILTKSGLDQSPCVAPNGSLVLFSTRAGHRQVLGMVTVDGRMHLRFPASEGDVREPDWSST